MLGETVAKQLRSESWDMHSFKYTVIWNRSLTSNINVLCWTNFSRTILYARKGDTPDSNSLSKCIGTLRGKSGDKGLQAGLGSEATEHRQQRLSLCLFVRLFLLCIIFTASRSRRKRDAFFLNSLKASLDLNHRPHVHILWTNHWKLCCCKADRPGLGNMHNTEDKK